ncbi:MFS transporter [Trueperella bialowiezensis]|uniref:Inner membrane symporter yihP n=1 Tax=Trueperella bialowiezensis TaxID=312285 RepID=A0A3S4VF15_9ACTO|nr:glycoside-pentoside-hexuronide (GPH):cation symporter [Trueperella bialowiezensis]VEI12722.1 Inner membrane symporter yihP [Trueperella bialowiezensis]
MNATPSNTPVVAPRKVRPFGMRDKIGYMFGDFGNDFSFMLQAVFFMTFYTNVVGINPAHVGTLFLVARIVDGFTDVAVGIIVDRLPVKRRGWKFKRWIKYGAVPVALASFLMYQSFVGNFSDYNMKLLWMIVSYVMWGSVAYTIVNIPYGSMASVISDDPDDRAQLSVFRSTGAQLAMLVINAAVPAFVMTENAEGVAVMDGQRMTIAAGVCSILAIVCYMVMLLNVEERVEPVVDTSSDAKGPGIGAMLKAVFTNRALGGLIVAALLLLLGNLFLGQMLPYLMLNYFGNGKLQSIATTAGTLPAFVLIVLAPWLAARFGKAETGAVAMLFGGIVLIAAWALKISSDAPYMWIVFYAVAMFCISTFNFLVWAFITDVIDDQEVRTGNRDDATVYSVYSWARKLGQALAGGLAGWALSAVGFDQDVAAAGGQQAPEVVDSIYMLANLVPGIACVLVGLALVFLYPLKKGRIAANVAELKRRREAAQQQA